MTDTDTLAALLNEKASLEQTISTSRARIAVIRGIVQGDKDRQGLAAKVEIHRRKQEWDDAAPDRAALRATPEYQEWYTQFKKDHP